jgi:hypothetical protein
MKAADMSHVSTLRGVVSRVVKNCEQNSVIVNVIASVNVRSMSKSVIELQSRKKSPVHD